MENFRFCGPTEDKIAHRFSTNITKSYGDGSDRSCFFELTVLVFDRKPSFVLDLTGFAYAVTLSSTRSQIPIKITNPILHKIIKIFTQVAIYS